jgi:hypothetical protein
MAQVLPPPPLGIRVLISNFSLNGEIEFGRKVLDILEKAVDGAISGWTWTLALILAMTLVICITVSCNFNKVSATLTTCTDKYIDKFGKISESEGKNQ